MASNEKGKLQVSELNGEGDGFKNLLVHFGTEASLLGTSDLQGVMESETVDGRLFRSADSVKVIQ